LAGTPRGVQDDSFGTESERSRARIVGSSDQRNSWPGDAGGLALSGGGFLREAEDPRTLRATASDA
jgi:hypothetical protein